jgi:hypothetical protein
MKVIHPSDLEVPTVGSCAVESPMQRHWAHADEMEIFVSDKDKILLHDSLKRVATSIAQPSDDPRDTMRLRGSNKGLRTSPRRSDA